MLYTPLLKLFIKISRYSIFCVCLLLTACFTSTSSTSTTQQSELDIAVKGIINHTVTPALDSFSQQTEELDALANSVCDANTKTEAELLALQKQWIETNKSWFKLIPYLLGPLTTKDFLTAEAYLYIDSYRQRGQDGSGAIRSDISALLISDEINKADFSSKNFDTVGLLALEILLFEASDTQSNSITDIATEFQNIAKKCDILIGQTYELNRRMAVIHQAWHQDYRDTGKGYQDLLLNKLLEQTFTEDNDIDGTGTPAFTRLVLAVQSHLDYLNKRNVTTDTAQLSNSIWQALAETHSSINTFLAGTGENALTLYDMMGNGYDNNVNTLIVNMASFKLAIDESNTTDFNSFAATLDGNFKRELPESLDTALGLNFSDGD
mgnify:CR=1 FL=1